MKQITIGICDDEAYFLEEVYTLVSACGNDNRYNFSIAKYLESEILLEDIESGRKDFDLLFLDIDMPKLSGIEVAERLRKEGYEGVICFVTSHNRYALDAYGVEALGYLLKPAQYAEVKRLMEKAVIQIFYGFDAKEAEKRYLEVSARKSKQRIDMQKILYVEKRRNQSVIHLEDGEVVCYETLKSLFQRLNQEKFCYAHQGFVVNFDKIQEVAPASIILDEGKEIPVSRKYQKILRERHMNLIYQIRDERRKREVEK